MYLFCVRRCRRPVAAADVNFLSKITKKTFVSGKSRWLKKGRDIFVTFASNKSQWLQLFATFANDKSQWLHLFFSNTLLRIATTGLRRQSDRKYIFAEFTIQRNFMSILRNQIFMTYMRENWLRKLLNCLLN